MAFIDKIKRPRVIIAVCAAVVVLLILFSLNNGLVWVKNIGGRGDDRFESVVQAPGGGFVAVGVSYSNDGDIPDHNAIIAKFTEDGNLVWIKNVGGTSSDEFCSVVQAPDGGFVAVGGSLSNDGDISENKGKVDAIIAKFNEDGELVWIKNVGGNLNDFFNAVNRASDGGFVAVGRSQSFDGDMSGRKGTGQAIIAKFTEDGGLVWIKKFGRTAWEGQDEFFSVVQAPDGGFVAVGGSLSNDGFPPDNNAIIAKFNEDGDLVWTKAVGGTAFDEFSSVVQAPDGGFVAAGFSISNDGDIPDNKGFGDAIIAKFTEDGDLVWIKTVGGTSFDEFRSVVQAPDGGFVAVGSSTSNDGDIPGNKGSRDAIIAMFAEDGELVWIKSVGGSKSDIFNAVVQAPDGGFVAVGVSLSSFGVFSLNKGSEDAIIAKFNVR